MTGARFYVAKDDLEVVLRNNAYFSQSDLSISPLAAFGPSVFGFDFGTFESPGRTD